MLASQTLSPLQELQRDEQLSAEEAAQYVERIKKEMMVAKVKADAQRSQQEANLHKKMSDLKKKRFEEKVGWGEENEEKKKGQKNIYIKNLLWKKMGIKLNLK